MRILIDREITICDDCGKTKLCSIVALDHLCKHFLTLCDDCLEKLAKLLTERAVNTKLGKGVIEEQKETTAQ